MLVVAANSDRALCIYEDLCFYRGQLSQALSSRILYYAADDVLPYSEMLPDRGAIQSRLRGLLELQQNNAPIMVMSAAAIVRKVLPRMELSNRSELIVAEEEIDRERLLKNLIECGYQRVPVVEDCGTFAVRGSLIDIFSPLFPHPVRIELDDLLVYSIRFFEPETQRTRQEVRELLIGPVDEALCNTETLKQARQRFADLADHIEYPTLEMKQLLGDLEQGLLPFGIQRLIPGFFEQLESIFDYLPPNALLVMDEPDEIEIEINRYWERMEHEHALMLEQNNLAFPPEEFLLSHKQFSSLARRLPRIEHRSVLLMPIIDQSDLSDVADEPFTSDVADEPVTSDIADEPFTSDIADEPVTSDIADEPVTSDIADEPFTSDVADEPFTSDVADEPFTSDVADEPFTSDVADEPDYTKPDSVLINQTSTLVPSAALSHSGVHWASDGAIVMPYSTDTHLVLKQALQNRSPQEDRRLLPLAERIASWQEEGIRVVVVCGTKGQALLLQELFKLYELSAHIQEQTSSINVIEKHLGKRAKIDILLGRISEGFLFPRMRLAIISEEEIFGPKARHRRPRKKPLQQTELESLRSGDFVIHRRHGLARYSGLFTMTIDDITSDFLLLQYQGTDRLYVPITRLSLIERYTGGGSPELDRLRSNSFEKKKSKARAAIQAMAGSLLQLYAERQVSTGIAFAPPDDTYYDFAARFCFEETPDQWQAIEETLLDMQSERSMDRVICGDVGYGKTEVAMRAAFLAAYSGKQVAVLVPTTILAQQHGLTFTERFEGYPIKIGILSRFQAPKEHKKLLQGLASGEIDIVIGTHRLLSRDVRFRDLGLLIIDEEHRFGVKQKEQVKQFKKMVDVLTLTATPIPRTLEMSIAGIRDLSLIRTPPHDRLAIRTSIAPYDEQIIRETIMRELNRGGQVFFLHNRIESIAKIQTQLSQILPEARIVVAHGQMPESELERAMLDFIQGKYNILLCTAIIESGLDIPRANTIIIDRADTFGLAQLYQIRGRVGRSRDRAYALLLVPRHQKITPESKERLAILQRFTELGAGFDIARHDLELRGAGNLLGKEQSGHVHAIGLDLYLEILEETVAELQNKPLRTRIEPEVKLGCDVYIPDWYIPDIQLRLQCYRRLSNAESPEELHELREEFYDRFGILPTEVDNLFQLIEIQQHLADMLAVSGEVYRNRFRIFFSPDAPLDLKRILSAVQRSDAFFGIIPPNGIEMTETLSPGNQRFPEVLRFLNSLKASIFEAGSGSNTK
jgi:transcription-repair coupling factor